jgi:hypothetical protein
MGQYWMVVNLDKREYVHPHKLGAGLKLWEQLGTHPGTGAALIVLCAAMPAPRGGGDLRPDPVIGRWAGDRIALVGDYAEREDLPDSDRADLIYALCRQHDDLPEELVGFVPFVDVSEVVCRVLERELGGKFEGDGWRHWAPAGGEAGEAVGGEG